MPGKRRLPGDAHQPAAGAWMDFTRIERKPRGLRRCALHLLFVQRFRINGTAARGVRSDRQHQPSTPPDRRAVPMLRSRLVKNLLLAAAALLLGYAFVRFFLAQVGPGRSSELAAVGAAPPARYEIVERGEMAPARAAHELASLLAARPGRIGIRFSTPRASLYW